MRNRSTTLLVSALLVAIGIVIGIALASDLGWLPVGHAVPESPSYAVAQDHEVTRVSVPLSADRNFVEVVKSVRPAVVNIFTVRAGPEREQGQMMPFDDPFFRRFFGEEFFRRFEHPRERKERSLGSGVIVDKNGLIITNNHVVSRADEIKVHLNDKRRFTAKLVGTDPKTDLAVLKIEAESLPTVTWADSDKLEVG
ncbi:MAG: trypsin-like peptidase domain-containing protein, partial [Nitrospiraceae bacterium]